MGIKRVVGEIQIRKPESTIVINGLLPRASKEREGQLYNNDGSISIMDAIDNVNGVLKEFCDQDDSLYYFDAKDIFVHIKEEEIHNGNRKENQDHASSMFIPSSLMADYLHPTALGYQHWAIKIVDELRTILDGQLITS